MAPARREVILGSPGTFGSSRSIAKTWMMEVLVCTTKKSGGDVRALGVREGH